MHDALTAPADMREMNATWLGMLTSRKSVESVKMIVIAFLGWPVELGFDWNRRGR